jgi:tetratricopeptide (TPR) repeat protein
LKYYNDAEKEQPDDADLLHQKGNLLAVIGQLKEAEDYINKAIDKQPAVSLFR